MGELDGHSTFLLGLRVDEDGDLRFAVGDSVIEICLTADDELLTMREVIVAEVEESELAPWEALDGPQ
jgi:hypothetical protein